MKHRLISLYLPQFHPFPENDKWWGKGFTEWTNVTKAKPLFKGHYQPHLPTDNGFYDLRLQQVRIDQANLAREYGIYGFCYYHYWFNGKRLMHEPLDGILNSREPDFPFMYCWANENWTKRWDGNEENILIQQNYSEEDDIAHITYLIENVFNDPRYIRVDNKPFFVVYRPSLFPDIKSTIRLWRQIAAQSGIELYLGYMQGFRFKEDPALLGFDVAIDFQPNFYTDLIPKQPTVIEKVAARLKQQKSVNEIHRIFDYGDYVKRIKAESFPGYNWFPSITPMWDNSARRKTGAFIFNGSTPERYQEWLEYVLDNFNPPSEEENFVFINAWNEWAEGNHLEPCIKWGRKYLEATKNALQNGTE